MKTATLAASSRTPEGTRSANRTRKEGLVPCVLYGEGTNTHFTLDHVALQKVVHSPNTYRIELNIDGKDTMALIKEVQFHPVTDNILHVDFLELNVGKKTAVELGVVLTGQSVGVRKGGRLVQSFRKLKVRGVPADLPDTLEIPIDGLDIGDIVRVKDLSFDNAEILDPKESVVAAVRTARTVVEPVAGEDEATEGDEAAPADGEAPKAEGEGGDAKAGA